MARAWVDGEGDGRVPEEATATIDWETSVWIVGLWEEVGQCILRSLMIDVPL